MKAIARLAALVALFVGVGTIGASTTLAAGTCYVPSDHYPTIQSAVSDPTCGTVIVAPGTYPENVMITRPVTIDGAQAGNPVSGRTFGGPSESTVTGAATSGEQATFAINSTGVTIDGFSVTNAATSGSATGIVVDGPGSGALITNNIMDNITTADPSTNGTAQGVYLQNGPDSVSIVGNEIDGVSSSHSAKGVLIGDKAGTNPSDNTVIENNAVSNIHSDAKGGYGVSFGQGASTSLLNSGIQVLDNTFSNLSSTTGWVHGVGMEANVSGAVIDGNTFSNLMAPSSDNVAVWFENEDTSFATSHVNGNNFDVPPPVFGIAVHPALSGGPVDGTCNWWGSPSGPSGAGSGTGAAVSPNVTYSPWLTGPAPGGACNSLHPTNKDQCKNGGWQNLTRADFTPFKNQGDCIQYVNTGK